MTGLLVQTTIEYERFTNIWLPIWKANRFTLESSIVPGNERYILLHNQEEYGSVEAIPFNYDHSLINNDFPFHYFTFLKNKNVIEFNKLVIKKEMQSLRKLHETLLFLANYSIDHNYDYIIALVDSQLYNTLVWRYKLPVVKLYIPTVHTTLIPIAIDTQKLKNSPFYEKMKSN
ncbi:hypothetical protein QWY14_07450 [Planococcus sp. N028]|uniref:Uncharacterized protein n=1 Tax=Planococcus shixiaomingii TaxID=3058393 RepID=A0ABT8N169_9BACL|nr:hypothetical protein [Planococcus sp. N028]MDN7241623.1 hypothetical protein [Planococcus sp. N028]